MYTGGFLRLELEFNKQKDKINQLESVVESMKTSKGDDIAEGKLVWETEQRYLILELQYTQKRMMYKSLLSNKPKEY